MLIITFAYQESSYKLQLSIVDICLISWLSSKNRAQMYVSDLLSVHHNNLVQMSMPDKKDPCSFGCNIFALFAIMLLASKTSNALISSNELLKTLISGIMDRYQIPDRKVIVHLNYPQRS